MRLDTGGNPGRRDGRQPPGARKIANDLTDWRTAFTMIAALPKLDDAFKKGSWTIHSA